MRKKILISFVPLFILLSAMLFLISNYPTVSPFKAALYFLESFFNPHAPLKKEVIGFLPYWKVEDIDSVNINLLSEINYFSLYVGPDGHIKKVINAETDPGWREWNKDEIKDLIARSQIRGTRFSISVTNQSNDDIENILNSKKAQETLISEIKEEIRRRHINGINIDFEYLGEADPALRSKFTSFSEQLSQELKKDFPYLTLSLSIMPLSAREKDIFDFNKLVPLYDRFIGMSYDYYGVSSDIAGPVAPMRGFKDNKYFFDVETTYRDYLKVVPENKIIMGIPYYGWDRAVEEGKKINSLTVPESDPNSYTAIMSFSRSFESQELKGAKCQWDDYALSTWCYYTKNGVDHQVWLEDERSIGIKYDFAKKQDFAGTAIWVLGYDKGRSELWEKINSTFAK